MQTITRRNNWRTLSDSEIEKAMPWMKITHRYRMSVAIGLLLMFGIPVIAFPVLRIVNSGWTEFLKTAWIYICAVPFIFIAVYFIVDYSRKMKCFAKGEFQATNVTVSEKAFNREYRNHYYAVYVSGLYANNKAVKKKFKVSRWIYKYVESGDRALVIRYNYKKLKDPLADLDFIPAIED
jgi:hypothetical protein